MNLKNLFRKEKFYCSNQFCKEPLIKNLEMYYNEVLKEAYCSFNCAETARIFNYPYHNSIEEPNIKLISRKEALKLLKKGKLKNQKNLEKKSIEKNQHRYTNNS